MGVAGPVIRDRIFGLDILRASAIIFVVYAHLIYGFIVAVR